MDTKIKRRVFLGVSVGALVLLPFVTRSLRKRTNQNVPLNSEFNQTWQAYSKRVDVPLFNLPLTSKFFTPKLHLIPNQSYKYLLLLSSFLPPEFSGEDITSKDAIPHMFIVTELSAVTTPNDLTQDEMLIHVGETKVKTITQNGSKDSNLNKKLFVVKDGKCKSADGKGEEMFGNLLSLSGIGDEKLAFDIGKEWSSTIGRIKPFVGLPTTYRVTGFVNICDTTTIKISFVGPNYQGIAYFDIESALLIRQETNILLEPNPVNKIGSGHSHMKFIIQRELS